MTEESVRWRKWCRDIIVNGRRVDDTKEKPNRYTTEEIPVSGTVPSTLNFQVDEVARKFTT